MMPTKFCHRLPVISGSCLFHSRFCVFFSIFDLIIKSPSFRLSCSISIATDVAVALPRKTNRRHRRSGSRRASRRLSRQAHQLQRSTASGSASTGWCDDRCWLRVPRVRFVGVTLCFLFCSTCVWTNVVGARFAAHKHVDQNSTRGVR